MPVYHQWPKPAAQPEFVKGIMESVGALRCYRRLSLESLTFIQNQNSDIEVAKGPQVA